jgi:hypothetical protein
VFLSVVAALDRFFLLMRGEFQRPSHFHAASAFLSTDETRLKAMIDAQEITEVSCYDKD